MAPHRHCPVARSGFSSLLAMTQLLLDRPAAARRQWRRQFLQPYNHIGWLHHSRADEIVEMSGESTDMLGSIQHEIHVADVKRCALRTEDGHGRGITQQP